MPTVSRQILFVSQLLGSVGLLYFLTLVVGLPLWACGLLLVGAAWLLYRTTFGNRPTASSASIWHWLFLLAGAALITNRAYHVAEVHGGWDAWLMWNLKAQALANPTHWAVFLRPHPLHPHADYPLMVPAINGFFMRVCGPASYEVVPYLVGFACTLLVPAWIYSHLASRSLLVAAVVLLLFAVDDAYLFQGVQQYADGPLGLFVLGSVLAAEQAIRGTGSRYAAAQFGFFLGCCLWTKNEGLLAAAVLALFWLPLLIRKRQLPQLAAGLFVPLVIYTFFKLNWPNANDLVQGRVDRPRLQLLTTPGRYTTIWKAFQNELQAHFFWVHILFWQVAGYCVLAKRWPGRAVTAVLVCVVLYNAVYLVTPHDLDWHLATSQQRLLFQLMPAFVYAAASVLCDLRLPFRHHRPTRDATASLPAGSSGKV